MNAFAVLRIVGLTLAKGITCADLPNLVSFMFVCKHTQLDEGKYGISHLFDPYKDAEYDRLTYSLGLCTKGTLTVYAYQY
jgi:hypothetical protein